MAKWLWTPSAPVRVFGTDAEYLAWLNDLHSKLLEAGLVRTADTGQFDLVNGVLPPPAGMANVAWSAPIVYRLNDAQQGNLPVFIRVRHGRTGTNSSSAKPVSAVQIGTGTNGAGVLTGKVSPELISAMAYADAAYSSKAVQTPSRMCAKPEAGFFGLVYSPGNYSNSSYYTTYLTGLQFFIQRSQAADGTPTDESVTLWASSWSSSTPVVVASSSTTITSSTISKSTAVVTTTTTAQPWVDSPEAVGGEPQLQRVYMPGDRLRPCHSLVTYPVSLMTEGDEFDAVVGTAQPTHFVCLGDSGGLRPSSLNAATWQLAMRFE